MVKKIDEDCVKDERLIRQRLTNKRTDRYINRQQN